MSLRLRLLLILAAAFLALSGVSVATLSWLSKTYEQALAHQLEASACVDAAREAQVGFKVQVQEWKNVLLRGQDLQDRARYWRQFESREAQVERDVDYLVQHLDDHDALDAVLEFQATHIALGLRYREGLRTFDAAPERPQDADAQVRGIDREPTDTLDGVVGLLQRDEGRRAQHTANMLQRTLTLAVAATFLVLVLALIIVPALLRQWVTSPLTASIRAARRLSEGHRQVHIPDAGPAEAGELLKALRHLRDNLVDAEAERDANVLALEHARDAALEAVEARERFLAIVSHELRTPLNGLVGLLELIDTPSAAEAHLLTLARRSTDRLVAVVDDVLTFTAARGDALVVSPMEVEVTTFVAELVRLPFEQARERGLGARQTLRTGTPRFLHADPDRVRQILSKLLDNAVRFTDEGTVGLDVAPCEGGVTFEVWDTGGGLDARTLALAHQPLNQAHEGLDRPHEGLGLGLAIAHAVAHAIGAELELLTGDGGTRARLTIPLSADGPDPVQSTVEASTVPTRAA